MKAVFLIQVIALFLFAVIVLLNKKISKSKILCIVSCIISVISGMIVLISGSSLAMLSLGLSLFSLVSLLLFLFGVGKSKNTEMKNTSIFISRALLVILLLEAVVFNFNCFHVWNKEYEKAQLSISDATIANLDSRSEGIYASAEKDKPLQIEFTDINKPIGTIYLDIDTLDKEIDYSIDFADESNSSYTLRSNLVTGKIYPTIESSKYIICNFSGEVSKLKINLKTENSQPILVTETITLNADYPSQFSLLRMIVFLLSAVFVYLFTKSVFMNSSIESQKNNFSAGTTTVIVFFIAVMFFVMVVGNTGFESNSFQLETGNQITQELVEAFKDGHVALNETPSDELLALENPYDWSQRMESGVDALWDHVLYEGKYYSYYGIGPVLLLFLPYNLITGYYFPSSVATFIFSAIGIIFLALTFKKLAKKHFSDIPMSMYIVSLVMLIMSSGIWYCLISPNFYEIAQTSGFCFVTLGAYFLIDANTFSLGKIKPISIALSSLFFAIAVTCRPTTAVWCVVALLFIGAGVVKIYRDKKVNVKSLSYTRYLVCALLPFVVIGAGQMIYNYVRFDSFTDFGIQYSLTINDFTSAQYHTQFAAIGFYNYLFAPPSFSSEFPFVMTNISNLDVNGYYFIATNNGCGLFFRALPVFALFLAPSILKYIKKENRAIISVLFLAVAVVAPSVIIFSIWESGYGVRYIVDFAWQMLICALCVIFILYRNTEHEETKRIYRGAMLIAMFACIIVNFALYYSYVYPNGVSAEAYPLFTKISRAFCVFNT